MKTRIVLVLIGLSFSITAIVLFVNARHEINELTLEQQRIVSMVDKEQRTAALIATLQQKNVKEAFFDGADYLEKYVRVLMNQYQIKIITMKSKITEKEYGEVVIEFSASVNDFFVFLDAIENTEKLLVINNLSVRRKTNPLVEGTISITGYYAESN